MGVITKHNQLQEMVHLRTDLDNLIATGIITDNALGIKVVGIYTDFQFDFVDKLVNLQNGNRPTDIPDDNNGTPWNTGDAFIAANDSNRMWIYSAIQGQSAPLWLGSISFRGIQGNNGNDGSAGATGATGATGQRGSSIFANQSLTPPTNPLTNDIWIDLNFTLFQFNGTGWLSIGSIRGATGATGANGSNGLTPTVGVNGNWFIGGSDTGVLARGTNGQDGVSLLIQDGIWLINQLPAFAITQVGEAFIVSNNPTYQPYALYLHGAGGSNWTITAWGVGMPGQAGADGADGENGQGVPAGGDILQLLSKYNSTDYNTQWVNPTILRATLTTQTSAQLIGTAELATPQTVLSRAETGIVSIENISSSTITLSGTLNGASIGSMVNGQFTINPSNYSVLAGNSVLLKAVKTGSSTFGWVYVINDISTSLPIQTLTLDGNSSTPTLSIGSAMNNLVILRRTFTGSAPITVTSIISQTNGWSYPLATVSGTYDDMGTPRPTFTPRPVTFHNNLNNFCIGFFMQYGSLSKDRAFVVLADLSSAAGGSGGGLTQQQVQDMIDASFGNIMALTFPQEV